MKKLFLLILGIFLFANISFADNENAERQASNYYSVNNLSDDDEVIKSSSGDVFGITMTATATNGWVVVYDSADGTDITSSTEPKIELRQATQYNSAGKNWADGLHFYKGIYVQGDDAQGVVYYY